MSAACREFGFSDRKDFLSKRPNETERAAGSKKAVMVCKSFSYSPQMTAVRRGSSRKPDRAMSRDPLKDKTARKVSARR